MHCNAATVRIDGDSRHCLPKGIRRFAWQSTAGSSQHALEILHKQERPIGDIELPLETQLQLTLFFISWQAFPARLEPI